MHLSPTIPLPPTKKKNKKVTLLLLTKGHARFSGYIWPFLNIVYESVKERMQKHLEF